MLVVDVNVKPPSEKYVHEPFEGVSEYRTNFQQWPLPKQVCIHSCIVIIMSPLCANAKNVLMLCVCRR